MKKYLILFVLILIQGCGGGGSETPANDILLSSLTFADANLQTCVQNEATTQLATFVHDLTTIDCSLDGITQLSGIEALTGLTQLSLGSNSISDVSPLAGLTGLNRLYLYNNSISDVSPLASLTGLTTLYLYDNSISDVSPLAGLTGLTTLYLDNNSIGGQGIGNVDALVSLTSATTIALTNNIGMSCSELTKLISTLGSPPVNIGAATDGVNCTNP